LEIVKYEEVSLMRSILSMIDIIMKNVVIIQIRNDGGQSMRIAYVIGTAVATIKNEKLRGHKLLLIQIADPTGKFQGDPFIAVDTVDAGTGDLVIITEGSSARKTELTTDIPVDAVIIAVIDSLEISGEITFRKE
jgi:microcompartment protein CcmK/EutM